MAGLLKQKDAEGTKQAECISIRAIAKLADYMGHGYGFPYAEYIGPALILAIPKKLGYYESKAERTGDTTPLIDGAVAGLVFFCPPGAPPHA